MGSLELSVVPLGYTCSVYVALANSGQISIGYVEYRDNVPKLVTLNLDPSTVPDFIVLAVKWELKRHCIPRAIYSSKSYNLIPVISSQDT